jgi:hypothetical protein
VRPPEGSNLRPAGYDSGIDAFEMESPLMSPKAGLKGPSKTIRVEPVRQAPERRPDTLPERLPQPAPAKEPAKGRA